MPYVGWELRRGGERASARAQRGMRGGGGVDKQRPYRFCEGGDLGRRRVFEL